MALHTEKPGIITTGLAGAAITKRRFIGFDDKVISVYGALAKGVSREEDSDINESFAIVISGTALVEAGQALTKGQRVTSSALGKAVNATKNTNVNGIVMRDQATSGQLVEVFLTHGQGYLTNTTTTTSSTSSTMSTTSTAA